MCVTAAEMLMNILLQNKKTLSYLTDRFTWTKQREKARAFETGIEALLFCLNRHPKNPQILWEFANPRLNFTFPVKDHMDGSFPGRVTNECEAHLPRPTQSRKIEQNLRSLSCAS
jgi:hypothetical protein